MKYPLDTANKCDGLDLLRSAAELGEKYPRWQAEIPDLFDRIAVNNAELSRLHQGRTSGVKLHLLEAELEARGLTNFSPSDPSLAKELRIPDFEKSDQTAWPRKELSLAAAYAMSMVPKHDHRYSADWAAAREHDNARRAQEEKRQAEEHAKRDAQRRRAYEASLLR